MRSIEQNIPCDRKTRLVWLTPGLRLAVFLIVLMPLVLVTGCLTLPSNLSEKTDATKTSSSNSGSKETTSRAPLVKPLLDETSDKKDMTIPSSQSAGDPKERTANDESGGTRDLPRSLSEQEKVKLAALESAKALEGIERMKVCFDKEHEEWWAILYQDAGSIMDLKQFVWNPKTQKLDPFLVIRHIPKDKLEAELKKKETGRVCTQVEVPLKMREAEKP